MNSLQEFRFTRVQRGQHRRAKQRYQWAGPSNQIPPQKQKQYLRDKFSIGESTGNKANPVAVAKSMISARDSNGQHLFSSAEFLTSKQISSFFSRLAAKRTLPVDLAVIDVDEESTEYEQGFEDLRNEVIAKRSN